MLITGAFLILRSSAQGWLLGAAGFSASKLLGTAGEGFAKLDWPLWLCSAEGLSAIVTVSWVRLLGGGGWLASAVAFPHSIFGSESCGSASRSLQESPWPGLCSCTASKDSVVSAPALITYGFRHAIICRGRQRWYILEGRKHDFQISESI